MSDSQSEPKNPIIAALQMVFAPMIKATENWPPLLAYGLFFAILITVVALLGAVVPDNLAPLLYLVFGATLLAFIWTDWSARRLAETKSPAPTPAATPMLPTSDADVVKSVGKPASPANVPPRRRYLESVAAECNHLRMIGLDPEAADAGRGQQLGLEQVYISLDTRTTVDDKERKRDEQSFLERERQRPLTALQVLWQAPQGCAVLLGRPGSGKSTFARHLALQLAQACGNPDFDYAACLPGWGTRAYLPVIIPLGRFAEELPADTQKGSAELVEKFIRADGNKRADYGEQLLKELKNGLLILFDGLDEVADLTLRPVVRDAVTAFAGRYQNCRCLVTCRTFSYLEKWKFIWPTHQLAPFGPKKISDFVAAWYTELSRIDQGKVPVYVRKQENLQKALSPGDPRRLAEIADNPLVLTVMAVVHTHEGELPDTRALVYDRCVNLLISRWHLLRRIGDQEDQEESRQSLYDALDASRSQVARVLQTVAYKAHRIGDDDQERSGTLVTEPLLVETLHTEFGGTDKGRKQVGIFLDYCQKANGLLLLQGMIQSPGALPGTPQVRYYSFPHLTFEEYLAARYLDSLSNWEEDALRHFKMGDRWRKVIMFLAEHLCFSGSGRIPVMQRVLDQLCPAEPLANFDHPAQAGRAAWLAGDALTLLRRATGGKIAPDAKLDARIVDRLASLIQTKTLPPPERAAAGRTLAALPGPAEQGGAGGDPRPGVGLISPPARGGALPDIAWQPVPAGPFIMGSDKKQDPLAHDDEMPQHDEQIEQPYALGRYPVTNVQYAAFVAASGYEKDDYWTKAGWAWKKREERTAPPDHGLPFNLPNHPVVGVSWYEAVAFCRWLTGQVREWGKGELESWGALMDHLRISSLADLQLCLPTEAQWEKAARGTDGRVYPWVGTSRAVGGIGEFDPNKCNMVNTGINTTSAVGIFPEGASPCGALDMSGNVWEWCGTKWRDSYKEPADESLEGTSSRVSRGGAFRSYAGSVRAAYRYGYPPVFHFNYLGFRVAASCLSTSDL